MVGRRDRARHGGGSGIGAAVTRRFVAEGARVVGFDRSEERLAALRTELGAAVTTSTGDVRSYADNERAVRLAEERFGALDVFVGNAGIWDAKQRLSDLTPDELMAGFTEVFTVNVGGYLLGAKAAAPAVGRRNGAIIFTLSTSSFYTGGGGPLYVASKHACLGLVRALAHELAPAVRVNGVAPSGTPTNLANPESLSAMPPSPGRGGPGNLLELAVQADDHAGAYVLLASRYGRAITGTVIQTDAGRGVMGGLRKEP